jgi:hypothetical protein
MAKDDLAEHAGELVVVFVMSTSETEPTHSSLAAFARVAGAPAPPRVGEPRTLGPDAVYYNAT